jgi:hypothetical protein
MRVLLAPAALAANSASASSRVVRSLRWWLAAYMSRNWPGSSSARSAAMSQGTSARPASMAAASRRCPSITRYPSPSGVTRSGVRMPSSRTDAMNSSSRARSRRPLPGCASSRATAITGRPPLGYSDGGVAWASPTRTAPSTASPAWISPAEESSITAVIAGLLVSNGTSEPGEAVTCCFCEAVVAALPGREAKGTATGLATAHRAARPGMISCPRPGPEETAPAKPIRRGRG